MLGVLLSKLSHDPPTDQRETLAASVKHPFAAGQLSVSATKGGEKPQKFHLVHFVNEINKINLLWFGEEQ
jgi:hypothetical protein